MVNRPAVCPSAQESTLAASGVCLEEPPDHTPPASVTAMQHMIQEEAARHSRSGWGGTDRLILSLWKDKLAIWAKREDPTSRAKMGTPGGQYGAPLERGDPPMGDGGRPRERGLLGGGVGSRIKKVASVERYLEFGGRGEVGDL